MMGFSTNASQSALSMVANVAAANPIAAAIVVGSFVAIIAGEYAYKKYEAYEEKIHKDEIEAVNKLYRTNLRNIKVLSEEIHLPPIFSPVMVDGKETYNSLHMTREEVEEILGEPVELADPALLGFNICISDAIRKLKEFYLKRKSETDVTAGIISWLLYTLETHCQNFQGYAVDIALLEAIEQFISEYKSTDNTEKSELFSWMSQAHGHLLDAIEKLKMHRESLSFRNLIGELSYSCRKHSDELIRSLVRLTIDDGLQSLADSVTIQELSKGILHQKHFDKAFLGLVIPKSEKKLRTFFKYWIKPLAKYSTFCHDGSSSVLNEFIRSPKKIFIIPEMSKIRSAFGINANFLTRMQKNDKMVEITDETGIINRLAVFHDIATLAHQLISLEYLCLQLTESFQLLGSIYIDNPAHMQSFFYVVSSLSDKICENADKTGFATAHFLGEIDQQKRLNSYRTIPNRIKEMACAIKKTIKKSMIEIHNAHEKNRKAYENPHRTRNEFDSVKNRMLQLSQRFAGIYEIPYTMTFPEDKNLGKEEKVDKDQKSQGDNYCRHDGELFEIYLDESLGIIQDTNMALCGLLGRILDLQNAGLSFQVISAWFDLHRSLVDLQQKAHTLTLCDREKDNCTGRIQSILLLTTFFSKIANNLMQLKSDHWKIQAGQISKEIREEINDPDITHAVDSHQRTISRIAYTIMPFSFFQTVTRSKVNTVCHAFRKVYEAESEERLKNPDYRSPQPVIPAKRETHSS